MTGGRRVDRLVKNLQEGPASVRNAIRLIVAATILTTFAGAAAIRIFDHKDFPNLGVAMWWALQTVTTVGYGDVTPKNAVGRLIGSLVLVYAVAFLTILTATITTSFIERARRKRQNALGHEDPVIARLDDIADRLERLERRLAVPGDVS
ncbi:MAG: two pore domain potassium channel family protein [Acidimicrobiia bacterium]|nr:two pore domain potassium channel family protein [Acidimicrobiia bacterium]